MDYPFHFVGYFHLFEKIDPIFYPKKKTSRVFVENPKIFTRCIRVSAIDIRILGRKILHDILHIFFFFFFLMIVIDVSRDILYTMLWDGRKNRSLALDKSRFESIGFLSTNCKHVMIILCNGKRIFVKRIKKGRMKKLKKFVSVNCNEGIRGEFDLIKRDYSIGEAKSVPRRTYTSFFLYHNRTNSE